MRFWRMVKWGMAGVGFLVLLLLVASAVNNGLTPTHSQTVDQPGLLEKARIAEVTHLRRTLGDRLWDGWGSADLPLVVYNEEYAFLIGYPDPPPGWTRVPQMSSHGGAWEPVPQDTLDDAVYYRQRLPSAGETPQNFTVLIGRRWAASIQTMEWLRIALGSSFAESLPALFRPVFPRGFVAGLFVGSSDQYIALALHEAFHAYQGTVAPARLAAAEKATVQAKDYPFDDPAVWQAWQTEANALASGVRAASVEEARTWARQFLTQRALRRVTFNLNAQQVDYERQREWLEGLAKYTEVEFWCMAEASTAYNSLPALSNDPEFHHYQTAQENRSREINQISLTQGSQEVRFYYSGMAQAMLLDRLLPGWKVRILRDNITLEDLLRESLQPE